MANTHVSCFKKSKLLCESNVCACAAIVDAAQDLMPDAHIEQDQDFVEPKWDCELPPEELGEACDSDSDGSANGAVQSIATSVTTVPGLAAYDGDSVDAPPWNRTSNEDLQAEAAVELFKQELERVHEERAMSGSGNLDGAREENPVLTKKPTNPFATPRTHDRMTPVVFANHSVSPHQTEAESRNDKVLRDRLAQARAAPSEPSSFKFSLWSKKPAAFTAKASNATSTSGAEQQPEASNPGTGLGDLLPSNSTQSATEDLALDFTRQVSVNNQELDIMEQEISPSRGRMIPSMDQENIARNVVLANPEKADEIRSPATATRRHIEQDGEFQHPLTDVKAETPRRFHWKRGEQLGFGTFGNVYLGLNETSGTFFAVKQVALPDGSKSEVSTLTTEITLMKELDHTHIVRYLGTEVSALELYIFMEYVPGGSIAKMLKQFGVFNEVLIERYTRQILLGVEYLHGKGIVHRDIKGANVLVNDQGVAKLTDFGCSKQLQGMRSNTFEESMKAIQGSVPWMAPEVIKQTGFGRSSDIWSVGATVIEMATAHHAWPALTNNLSALFQIATTTTPPTIPETLSDPAQQFLSRCLVINPKDRASASQLLQAPFLRQNSTT